MRFLLPVVLFSSVLPLSAGPVQIPDRLAGEIGRRIWKNECGGSVSGLTSWNAGEDFASLGIAHFIWYPAGSTRPFQESFPGLIRFLKSHGRPVDDWMLGACPWKSRTEFQSQLQSPRMKSLRALLESTVSLQAIYASKRLEAALPKILAAAPPGSRATIQANFDRVASEPLGFYALMDYVNFKGEGTSAAEQYHEQGWGLLQVLESMPPSEAALPAFAKSARNVLTRRVKNSPPSRNEEQWLPGWLNRINTYVHE